MKTSINLLSQDLMLHALYDEHQRVLELTAQLQAARARRDDMIYDARQNQITLARISRTTGMSPANMHPILEKVERRRNGFSA